MGMTDDELEYWLARGSDITDATPIAGGSVVGEVRQMWLVVAELGRRILNESRA